MLIWKSPTLNLVDLYTLPDIHDLDVRPFLRPDRIVNTLLISYTRPIIGDGSFLIPALILRFFRNLLTEFRGRIINGTHVWRGKLDGSDVRGDDVLLVTY